MMHVLEHEINCSAYAARPMLVVLQNLKVQAVVAKTCVTAVPAGYL